MGALTEGLQGIISEEMIAAVTALIASFLFVFLAVGVLLAVLYIIAYWRIFKKADRSGWNVFIPIIGTYRFYQIAGAVDLFWKAILYGVILEVCDILPDLAPATMAKTIPALIVAIIGLVTSIASLILSIKFASRLSNAFGHGFCFTLGLIFFPYIFILILAFGRSKYCLEMPSGLVYKD